MDKFNQIMKEMSEMKVEDRIKEVAKKKEICICNGCLTYNQCARDNKELLYCSLGKSSACITKEIGCICPSCPITEQMGLENEFFCTRGSEKEQRAM